MAAPNIADLGTALVVVAPSPATTGTSLTVESGKGDDFPDTADGTFYCTLHPEGVFPSLSNAEIVAVTTRSTDTFTITRAQKGSTAKSVATGWRIYNGIYKSDIANAYIFTETEGADRASDDIDLFNYALVMRDTNNADWAIKINTDGALQSYPVMQDDSNSRILDSDGDIIYG